MTRVNNRALTLAKALKGAADCADDETGDASGQGDGDCPSDDAKDAVSPSGLATLAEQTSE